MKSRTRAPFLSSGVSPWPGRLGVNCEEVSTGSRCYRIWASKGPYLSSSQRSSGSLALKANVARVETRARGT
eukprot:3015290-Pyramimonas_sp.AAC.1